MATLSCAGVGRGDDVEDEVGGGVVGASCVGKRRTLSPNDGRGSTGVARVGSITGSVIFLSLTEGPTATRGGKSAEGTAGSKACMTFGDLSTFVEGYVPFIN